MYIKIKFLATDCVQFRCACSPVHSTLNPSRPIEGNGSPYDAVRGPGSDLLDLLPLESLHLGREGDGASAVGLSTLTHTVGPPRIHLSSYSEIQIFLIIGCRELWKIESITSFMGNETANVIFVVLVCCLLADYTYVRNFLTK